MSGGRSLAQRPASSRSLDQDGSTLVHPSPDARARARSPHARYFSRMRARVGAARWLQQRPRRSGMKIGAATWRIVTALTPRDRSPSCQPGSPPPAVRSHQWRRRAGSFDVSSVLRTERLLVGACSSGSSGAADAQLAVAPDARPGTPDGPPDTFDARPAAPDAPLTVPDAPPAAPDSGPTAPDATIFALPPPHRRAPSTSSLARPSARRSDVLPGSSRGGRPWANGTSVTSRGLLLGARTAPDTDRSRSGR